MTILEKLKAPVLPILIAVISSGCVWAPDGPTFRDTPRTENRNRHMPLEVGATDPKIKSPGEPL
jgi:hypothetical protein